MAVVAVVAVLVAALFTLSPGVASSASRTITSSLCHIASGFGGAECPGDAQGTSPGASPSDEAPSGPSLRERATAGDYVALGDSYSSGEGAGDYAPGTDRDRRHPWDDNRNKCHRSANAYSATIYQNDTFAGDYKFHACSGAIVDNYWSSNGSHAGEGPQADHIDENTSLITLSLGGNDFGFGETLKNCVLGSCGSAEDTAATQATIDAYAAQLLAVYQDMRDRAGDDAVIVVIGYPQFFPDDPTGSVGMTGMSPAEQAWANEMLHYANHAIEQASVDSGADIEYVDVTNVLAGHELGTSDPWMNDLSLSFEGWDLPVNPASFHPNAAGQAAIAEAVQAHLDQ